jgi:curli biogenesis system outer membrane secretion channel CsgG
MPRHALFVRPALVLTALLAALAAPSLAAAQNECRTSPPPVIAVIEFENTTAQHGTTVTGVEEAATARLITLLKESGCYEVVERSVLQDIIARQGLESLAPEALARAAGAGFVVTGVVTRATVARPQVALFGVTVGQTTAEVDVDVRVTDIITGRVLVSMTGRGSGQIANFSLSTVPTGTISFNDPAVGPLFARASTAAVEAVVAAIRSAF